MDIEKIITIVGGIVGVIGSIVSIILKIRADKREKMEKEVGKKESKIAAPQPEIKPSNPIPNNLPPHGAFIGREGIKREIHQALLNSHPSMVIIQGLGGIGKTSLALEIAQDYLLNNVPFQADTTGSFDGIIWATARNGDLSLNILLDTIARVLEQLGILQQDLDGKRQAVLELLQKKHCLLLVDNFETVTDENLILFLINLPVPTSLILTTREKKKILDNGRLITIGEMSLEEATELMRIEGERLNLSRLKDVERDVALKLYQATGGAPLAIKWAIGQIKLKGQPLDMVLDDLSIASGDVFKKIFERAWLILAEDAQKILCISSMFAAPAPYKALEATSQWDKVHFNTAIGQLSEMSFLELSDELEEHPRYGLHPLTRAYAKNKIEKFPGLLEQTVERLADYYIKFTEQFKNWRNEQTEPEVIEKEIQNVYRVIHYCLQRGLLGKAFTLLENPSHFMFTRGYWIDTLAISYQVLERLDEAISEGNQQKQDFEIMKATLLTWPISSIIRHRGDLDAAYDHSIKSLEILRRYKDSKNDAFVLRHLGRIEHERGNYAEAERYLTQSLKKYRREKRNRDWEIMVVNLNLAELHLEMENIEMAGNFCEIALPIAQRIKDTERIALIYGIMGGIHRRKMDLKTAEDYLKKAYEMMVAIKRLDAQADALTDLAIVYKLAGKNDEAINALNQALAIYIQLGIKNKAKTVKTSLQEVMLKMP